MGKFDLAVIGAGPGGYKAAIKAAKAGKRVILVEKKEVGGVCLNEGCIPTKTLISSAKALQVIKKAEKFGIEVEKFKINFSKMQKRKEEVILTLRKGLENFIKSSKVHLLYGAAKFLSEKTIQVKDTVIEADKIIIATGSKPIENKYAYDSTSILNIPDIPKTLVIVGGGYIGCEFASLFTELGTKVIIVEAANSIVSRHSKKISSFLTSLFKKKGIEIFTNSTLDAATMTLSNGNKLEAETVLNASGRRIDTKELYLDNANVKIKDSGAIEVNENMETSTPNIYAVGDVVGKCMLAHTAFKEGEIAVENCLGGNRKMDYSAIPSVVFSFLEIASVGLTAEEAKGIGIKTYSFSFQNLGKAVTAGEEGFSEIIVDQSDRIIGAQVVGNNGSNLISEMTLAIQNKLTIKDLINTIHPHPTDSECWSESVSYV